MPKVRRPVRVALRYGIWQVPGQLMALTSGILIVRGIAPAAYSHYLILTSAFAGLALLSESGINAGLMRRGGLILSMPKVGAEALGPLFRTGLEFRRVIALPLGLLVGLYLFIILLANSSTVFETIRWIALLLIAIYPSLNRGIFHTALMIQNLFVPLQRAPVVMSGARLAYVALLQHTNLLSVDALLFGLILENVFESRFYRHRIGFEIRGAPTDDEARPEFRSNIVQTLPANFLLVLQGQLFFLGLVVAGNPETLASIGAIARIALIFTVLNLAVATVGSGVLSRVGTDRALVTLGRIVFLYFGSASVLVAAASLLAPFFLNLLGPSFATLTISFVAVLVGTALINLGDVMRSLNTSRGWVKQSWLFAPITVIWFVVGIAVLPLDRPEVAAFWFAGQATAGLISQSACSIVGGIRDRRSCMSTDS